MRVKRMTWRLTFALRQAGSRLEVVAWFLLNPWSQSNILASMGKQIVLHVQHQCRMHVALVHCSCWKGAYCVYVEDEAQDGGLLLAQAVVQQHCSRALVHLVLRANPVGQRKVRQNSLAML